MSKELNLILIQNKAELLGCNFIGIVPVSAWETNLPLREDVEQTPETIWKKTKSVIVLSLQSPLNDGTIIKNDDRDQAVVKKLLNEFACKMALWLNEYGYPSIYIPVGDLNANMPAGAAKLYFSHNHAGELAGLNRGTASSLDLVSVFTSWGNNL